MPEVEYEYTFYYRGDLVRLTVYKNGAVVFDNAHESHTMPEEQAIELGDALFNTVGPGRAK